jgi:hypothetical protein
MRLLIVIAVFLGLLLIGAAVYDLLRAGTVLNDWCSGPITGKTLQLDQTVVLFIADSDGEQCSVTRHRLEIHKCEIGSRYPECSGVR